MRRSSRRSRVDLPEDDQVERCTRDVRLVEVNDAMVAHVRLPHARRARGHAALFDLRPRRPPEPRVLPGVRPERVPDGRAGVVRVRPPRRAALVRQQPPRGGRGRPADGGLGHPAGRHGAAPERGDGAGDARPSGGDRRGVAAPDRRGRHRRRGAELEPRRRDWCSGGPPKRRSDDGCCACHPSDRTSTTRSAPMCSTGGRSPRGRRCGCGRTAPGST